MEKTLEKALSELIETIRTDLEARSTPGDRREARSYAELLPVALIVDQKRISVDLREVPEPIRGRILARPIPLVIPAGPGKNAILDVWQRRCFDEAGYAITVLPLVPIELLTRGRRQRDEVESGSGKRWHFGCGRCSRPSNGLRQACQMLAPMKRPA